MTALIIAVYLIGCVVVYFIGRLSWHFSGKAWTKGSRTIVLKAYLWSWITAIILFCAAVFYAVSGDEKDDRPAKW